MPWRLVCGLLHKMADDQFYVMGSQENAEDGIHDEDSDALDELGRCAEAAGSLHSIVTDGLDNTVSEKLQKAPSSKMDGFSANGTQLPSESTIAADRSRLSERLSMYGLVEKQMEMDGNCQFRSLSDQLYRTPAYHDEVREFVVCHIKDHPQEFKDFVPDDFEDYCRNMAKDGTWGDHITLKAAADFYGVELLLLTSYPYSSVLQLEAAAVKSNRRLYMSFWAEIHYNSLYPEGELVPGAEGEKSLEEKAKRGWRCL
eukprot:evm.model.scf_519EXC.8 EVM.evm.TU.scf_519EXC.8   scf_519EXC:49788-52072(-)